MKTNNFVRFSPTLLENMARNSVTVEQINEAFRQYRDEIENSTLRKDVKRNTIAILDIIKRHSFKYKCVSYLNQKTIATKLEINVKTVTRTIERLVNLKYIKIFNMLRPTDNRKMSNLCIFNIPENIANLQNVHIENEKCQKNVLTKSQKSAENVPTIKQNLSLKQNILKDINIRNTRECATLSNLATPHLREKEQNQNHKDQNTNSEFTYQIRGYSEAERMENLNKAENIPSYIPKRFATTLAPFFSSDEIIEFYKNVKHSLDKIETQYQYRIMPDKVETIVYSAIDDLVCARRKQAHNQRGGIKQSAFGFFYGTLINKFNAIVPMDVKHEYAATRKAEKTMSYNEYIKKSYEMLMASRKTAENEIIPAGNAAFVRKDIVEYDENENAFPGAANAAFVRKPIEYDDETINQQNTSYKRVEGL